MIMINKIMFFVDSHLFSYYGDIFSVCVCVTRRQEEDEGLL